jgi:hypothetical protein
MTSESCHPLKHDIQLVGNSCKSYIVIEAVAKLRLIRCFSFEQSLARNYVGFRDKGTLKFQRLKHLIMYSHVSYGNENFEGRYVDHTVRRIK